MKAVLYIKSPESLKPDFFHSCQSLHEVKSRFKHVIGHYEWYGVDGQVHIEGKEPRKITLGKLGKPKIV